jgi:alpha-L-fucosidase
MATKYSSASPWFTTPITNNYLDIWQPRNLVEEVDDFRYVLEPQYTYRPDLLAYDLYGTPKLWWVFIKRNMDRIQDPIFDFIPGVEIFIPKKSTLFRSLGL